MAGKLELTFRQTAHGLDVESNQELHRRPQDVICLKRGANSWCLGALDKRDSPLVHAVVLPLLEEVDEVEEPLLIHRFRLHIEFVRGCALSIIEQIKERIIEICHSCGHYNVVLVSG